ncbi:hypothetical protein K502DRAFT_322508 [Neoconidiobolus thromboides FSU 785]|nr:hypothetical protein K502DRAFT_322508 [Neoconidiobolus thromboides FSU 785]
MRQVLHLINRTLKIQQVSYHSSRMLLREAIKLDFEPLIKLPSKPEPPPPELCCMSGCAICVLDVYQQDLDAYNELKKKYINQLKERGMSIPEDLKVEEKGDPGMDAFMMMEKRLKEK